MKLTEGMAFSVQERGTGEEHECIVRQGKIAMRYNGHDTFFYTHEMEAFIRDGAFEFYDRNDRK